MKEVDMDERFSRNRVWVAVGVGALVFLCLMLCAFGALATMMVRSVPAQGVVPYVQPPAGAEGETAPPTYYQPAPPALARGAGYGPLGFLSAGIGLVIKLMVAGLLLLLLLGLVKRVMWGHRLERWHHWGTPPKGDRGAWRPHPAWGPWAWRCDEHWGGPPEEEAEGDEPGEAYAAAE
jgi:hypothetical protein